MFHQKAFSFSPVVTWRRMGRNR